MFKLLLVFIIVGVNADTTDSLLVTLPHGQIRGHELKSESNNIYYAFQEIPYASPPIGDLRFKEPTAPKNWKGVLNATQNTKICYQLGQIFASNVTITEDCLYLNVYTPLTPGGDSKQLLPVLFWIHGGAFKIGDGTFQSYGPGFFMDYNIVVVTINYRLGPFGFLTTGDGVIPGNLGLKDQNFALKWTNDNINLFGGDPSKITIAGESAGAASVGHLIISKQSKGLFRGAILESMTPIGAARYQLYPKHYAYKMGTTLDLSFISDSTSEELLKLLQNVSASDIINANVTVTLGMEVGINDGEGLIWLPTTEDKSLENALVVGSMEENLEHGNVNRVPTLIGYNSEEILFFLREMEDPYAWLNSFASYLDEDLSQLIYHKFNMTAENKVKAGRELRKIYTKGNFTDDTGALVQFLSEQKFSTPVIRHADLESNYTDVYLYQFSYKGTLYPINITINGTDSVGHVEELFYLWDYHAFSFSGLDKIAHKRLLKLWTNFVKYLNPTTEEDELFDNILWPRVTPNRLLYLNINSTLEVKEDPKHYKYWVPVIEKYAIPPLITY